jgi:subtilisin family serine protease
VDNDSNPCEGCPENLEEDGPGLGHGTFVAGVILLVAPEAKIMPLRAFDADGRGTTFNVFKAIRYAVDNGANIINMSFGVQRDSFLMRRALISAYGSSIFLVASAGNKGVARQQYPAAYDNWVMAVAATDTRDVKADFSNFGKYVDVCAPGVGIYSAYPRDQLGQPRFGTWSGTSFATPFVSGEAALAYSIEIRQLRGQSVDPQVVRTAIESSAVNIDSLNPGFAGELGKGRIDVFEAVRRIRRR